MKVRWLSVLLIFCMLLTAMPVVGASVGGSGGGSASTAYQYGVILEVDDYYAPEGFLGVSVLFPQTDSFTQYQYGFAVTPSTRFNGASRYNDMSALYNALPIGTPIRFTAREDTVGSYGLFVITDLWSDTTPVTYDPFNTYNPSTGFEAPSNSAYLPVYRTEQWDDYIYFFPAYLDENHYYSIDAYDYGIFVNGMWAIEEDMYTIDITGLLDHPNKDFAATIDFYITSDIDTATLCADLYDAKGNKLQRQTGSVAECEGSLFFTDVPDNADTYTIEAWLQSGNRTISPVYEYTYARIPFDTYSGYITSVGIDNNGWQDYLHISLATGGNDTITIDCFPPTIVNGTTYDTVSELLSALDLGAYIEVAKGEYMISIRDATPPTPEPDTYGIVTRVINEDGVNASVDLVLPEENYVEYGYYLSQEMLDTIDNLNEWCRNLEVGSCVKFAVDEEYGTTIAAMDIDEDGGKTYTGVRYREASETFAGLSADTADLPVYYDNGERYCAPVIEEKSILNDDAIYDIKVYDYGIVITDREYVEINVLAFYPTMNIDFKQDLQVAYGIWDESALGKTLHVQLLDDRNKVLERASKVIVDGNIDEDPGVWFRNYPNEDAAYHLKLWITNETGAQISPTYTESNFDYLAGKTNTTELEIKNGTVVSENTSTHPNTIKIQIKSCPNGIQTTKYVTFSIGTNVNGKTFATAQELAAELPVGTLIEYVEGTGNYGSVIRFSKEKQQVVTDANYNETEKKVTAKVILKSNNTTTGTSATGTVYAGVYSKEGILKGVTMVRETELKADGTATDVPLTVEGVTLEAGDYIKAFFWDSEKNGAITNVATAKIQ